ncbi:MAG TPA: glycoside hydrolase family 30 beta sandwich domain-containing protein [Thermoleophilaceae bacterium]|jgi:glucosylceramidase|nr:glycoside hydrolase family 30 beta sandwich domain-containing protein [Thermoleophilaceae bacterium]
MSRRFVFVLLIALVTAWPAAAFADAPSAWMTTGDQKNLLTEQPSRAFGDPVSGAPTITIDPSQTFQKMEGVGASITDSSAHLLAESRYRDSIMSDLFDPVRGIGLSYLRQPMGASDFVQGPHYTYDDLPAGQTDFKMERFSIGHDRAQIIPLLRQALALNPNVKIMGTPWSPPAWMKTNDSLVGGRFIDQQRYYDAYARYFLRFVQDYEKAGVPIDALTLQNEPQNRNPSGYPGMDFRDPEEAHLVATVGPQLRKAGLKAKLLGYDHNWSLHPNDVGPPDDPANPDYAASLLSNPDANKWLAGTAYHCYSGDPSSQSALHDRFPAKDIYFTECSGIVSGNPQTTFPDTLHWHTRYLTIGAVRNWAKTVITWNMALDPNGGPHNGGCDTCTGVVTIEPKTGKATRTADYYVLGHYSKFVKPGAVRIGSTVDGNIWDVAFRNPDGSIVLIANNDDWGTGSQRFNVRLGDQEFSYELPAGAVVTFVI